MTWYAWLGSSSRLFYAFVFYFTSLQVKLMALFKGDATESVSDDECQRKLESLKTDMMKAFNYAQGQ